MASASLLAAIALLILVLAAPSIPTAQSPQIPSQKEIILPREVTPQLPVPAPPPPATRLPALTTVVRLSADRTGAEAVSDYHGTRGSLCGLTRGGTRSQFWVDWDLLVGYDHFWDSDERRRCEWGVSWTFLSLVHFDLSGLRGREVESATFRFTEHDRVDRDHRGRHTPQCTGTSAVDGIALALHDWPAGKREVSSHMPSLEPIRLDQLNRNSHEADVTRWVRRWLSDSPNNGIQILGRDYRQRKANRVCVSGLFPTGFSLEVRHR